MLAGYLCVASAAGNGQVEIQNFSSGQAVAFDVIPSAQHFYRDSEILRYRLDRIAFANLVVRSGMSVGAGIGLLAGRDRNNQTTLRIEGFVAQVVRFRDGFRRGVEGS